MGDNSAIELADSFQRSLSVRVNAIVLEESRKDATANCEAVQDPGKFCHDFKINQKIIQVGAFSSDPLNYSFDIHLRGKL